MEVYAPHPSTTNVATFHITIGTALLNCQELSIVKAPVCQVIQAIADQQTNAQWNYD